MNNCRFGAGPSEEWRSFGAAHPELSIDADGWSLNHKASAVELRSAVNAGREASSRAMCARDGISEKVAMDDYSVPTRDGSSILCRVYKPADTGSARPVAVPAYVFYHGGGFLFGTEGTEDHACASWALALGWVVVHVCYRHTPEHVFPTQHHDALDGFEWVVAHADKISVDPARIVVGGISAGGNVAAAVVLREAMAAKKEGRAVRIKGQLLAIPWLLHRDAYPWHIFSDPSKAALAQCADAPILPRARYDLFTDLLHVENPTDLLMSPGLADEHDLDGMPRTAFIANGWDVLRDDGFMYADKLERTGVPTKKHVFPGMPHAFRRWPDLPSSKRWDQVTVDSLRWCIDDSAAGDVVGSWS